jgi:branched-chain amino acid transport system substrate-binding protein
LNITDKDHSGGGKTRIDMWDGSKWVPQSDWSAEYSELVWATVRASTAEYVKSGK